MIPANFETWIQDLAKIMPLEIYVSLGAFLEEVVPPIPSPLIVMSAGAIAGAAHYAYVYLIWLAVIGAAGKVAGAAIVYQVTDKAEDLVVGKFGKFVGVSKKDIEGLGKRFSGGWKDDLTLFLLRATPIIPSSLVSVMSGVLKINWRTYLLQTFLGTIVRNLVFLYMGMLGASVIEQYMPLIDRGESAARVLGVLLILGIGGYFIAKKYKDKISDRIITGESKNKASS